MNTMAIRYTALHYACNERDIKMVKLLLKYNPNIDIKTKEDGLYPLDIATKYRATHVHHD